MVGLDAYPAILYGSGEAEGRNADGTCVNKIKLHTSATGDMGRDYKNVHSDVQALLIAGLLRKQGGRIVAPWDEVSASLELT